jgi:myo-inositol-1(or 4)-monophosphatase
MTVFEFTQKLAREAGELIVDQRNNAQLTHQYKNGQELVTNADLLADKLIIDGIKARYPRHHILSEESSPEAISIADLDAPLWIIDPIDGTVNYAHGHIQSAVSIAYVDGGAHLNGKAISVADETDLRRSIIATGFPYDKATIEPILKRVAAVLRECADIRRLGSAALDICWLASGRLDGYYESLSIWDFAAAQLVAREAGAQWGHFSEVPEGVDPQFHTQDILVANPALYAKLLTLLQNVDYDS